METDGGRYMLMEVNGGRWRLMEAINKEGLKKWTLMKTGPDWRTDWVGQWPVASGQWSVGNRPVQKT